MLSSDIAARFCVSASTVWRAAQAAGARVAQWREGRLSYLAATRAPFLVPVRRITKNGGVENLPPLVPLASGGVRWINWKGEPCMFDGLPPDIAHVRPQGFLGRAFAAQFARDHHLSSNPDGWSDDDVLHMLGEYGSDLPGDLVLGDAAFERYLATNPLASAIHACDLQQSLPRLAQEAMRGEPPGSSVGGEQPKFTVAALDVSGVLRHMIVKFSPALDSAPASMRWADLLACEHLANVVLQQAGVAASRTQMLEAGGRRFLLSDRFDRVGLGGRMGMISLGAIDDEYFGARQSTWVGAAYRLEHASMLEPHAARTLAMLYAFGVMIGNGDMHFGNVSFQPTVEGAGAMRMAPVYDMLPMSYAPVRTELRDIEFAPRLDIPGLSQDALRQAFEIAHRYWTECAGSTLLSQDFRGIASANALKLETLAYQSSLVDAQAEHTHITGMR